MSCIIEGKPQAEERSSAVQQMFEPYKAGALTVPTRFVMAPMTRDRAPDGVPGPANRDYYARRARAGVGLIVTEGTWIDHPAASTRTSAPRFYGEDAAAGWRLVVEGVHAAGGRIFPQLWHAGMVRQASVEVFNPDLAPIGPSGVGFDAGKRDYAVTGRPMADWEIADVIASFGRGASLAKSLGFDGIELHGAHGYLIDQFLWYVTNRRSDTYGGDWSGRTRFAAEIIAECRRQTGPDFPISFRFSQWKVDDYQAILVDSPQSLERMLTPLVDAGANIFHCSTRRYWTPAFDGSTRTLSGWTKSITGKTTICVGSIGLSRQFDAVAERAIGAPSAAKESLDHLWRLHDRGEFDLAALGRNLLVDPEWVEKLRSGRFDEIVDYDPAMRNKFY